MMRMTCEVAVVLLLVCCSMLVMLSLPASMPGAGAIPAVLIVSGPGNLQSFCTGTYELVVGKSINGKPVWENRAHGLYLAAGSDGSWYIDNVPQDGKKWHPTGYLSAFMKNDLMPNEIPWDKWNGSVWQHEGYIVKGERFRLQDDWWSIGALHATVVALLTVIALATAGFCILRWSKMCTSPTAHQMLKPLLSQERFHLDAMSDPERAKAFVEAIAVVQTEYAAAEERTRTNREAVHAAKAEAAKLLRENAELAKATATSKAETAAAEERAKACREALDTTKAEVAKLLRENAELSEAIAASKVEAAATDERAREALKGAKAEAAREIAQLRKELQAAQSIADKVACTSDKAELHPRAG
eukprot:gnl/TRDRNA2_/TRDRNA2_208243_c0_seq1.p1 gnl/TRDRNA2_/TRDRNA2_208243_c0~~gnl/TRDRNA2_/TRDRNA2_208243_c0_seq1.p1  ORF type:complete len:359 (+),score=67.23 gnl/TRDRNA2_/TRDRNA2_208243_c0_seq1:40-1116(+)